MIRSTHSFFTIVLALCGIVSVPMANSSAANELSHYDLSSRCSTIPCGMNSTCGCNDGSCRCVHRCGMPAPCYPVPHNTPTAVGHTRYTYPPMMPHHSLPHYKHVYSYRHGPGLSRTNVLWHPSYVHNFFSRVHHVFKLPR